MEPRCADASNAPQPPSVKIVTLLKADNSSNDLYDVVLLTNIWANFWSSSGPLMFGKSMLVNSGVTVESRIVCLGFVCKENIPYIPIANSKAFRVLGSKLLMVKFLLFFSTEGVNFCEGSEYSLLCWPASPRTSF